MKRAAFFILLLAMVARGDKVVAVPQGGIRIMGGGSLIIGGQVFTSGDAAPAVAGPTLRWKNGETLPGELAGASEASLGWKSPFFEDPLQLRWDVIDRIDWPTNPEQPKDPFAIALRDGSFIYGDLTAIGADEITIHSTRHGDAVLKRSQVLSIRRRENAKLVYAGPIGDVGWEPMINQQDGSVARISGAFDTASPVVTGPGGALMIRSWNRSAFLNITLPPALDVEFRLHSSRRPEFLVALGGNVREPLRVETWDNVLVLAAGDQFKIIRRIQDDERNIALRVCWDPSTQQCSVFAPTGELITTWKLSTPPSTSTQGFIVQNRGLDLSLDELRVRTWDGKAPGRTEAGQVRVDLDDGRTGSSSSISLAQGVLSVQKPDASGAATFPLSQVDAIIFSSDSPQVPAHASSLAFNDETLLFGHLVGLDNGRASLATSFTSQPLSVQMDSPRQLLVAPADQPASAPANETTQAALDGQDQIAMQDTTLHGKLGTTADGALGWMPVGGVAAARPVRTLPIEITRAVPKDAPLPGDPALFYLNSGDILPGSLRSLDRTGVQIESSLMDARLLPSAQLEAIEFSPAARLDVQGFNDPAWQIIKGDDKGVRREGNTLGMDAGTSVGMSSLMQCGDFSFKYASGGFSAMRVRLFCAGKDEANSTNILLCNTGAQFTTGLETTPGQFDNQFQIRTQPGTPVTVHFKMESNTVNLFVNDIPAGQFPVDPANSPGSGVILEPASVWGNGVFPVTLSGFSAHSVVGRTWLPEVNADIRKQVLTVPRFERDDPPRHVLLAANGDVLRGEIEAATDTHFGFRCGLENLNVPRERVRAVVWLQPPSKDAAPAAPTPAADAPPSSNPLGDAIGMRTVLRQIDLSSVLNFLRTQDRNLKIQAPDEATLHRVEALRLGGQSVADALTEICARFDLHYRLDPDNTVVLETPDTTGSPGMVAKTYWIKPDALPAGASAQDALAAKGINFPSGASVNWPAHSGVLTMVNTDVNQGKLATLVASEFGGSAGSPTHWIELTSGGRLALAVDKFAPDFIYAHQPTYGAIKIPMVQVAAIRTTAPPETAASRALEDWRLVNAPEPVIPEGNGENSPLLGKDAPAFRLPMLTGGYFDLASEKGHVVVIDFWASWCGPCVRSLPGLVKLTDAFPAEKVRFVGINQGEAPEQVKHFLEARGLRFMVAMDPDQSLGRKYGVDAIPRTIVVGPDGKVAWEQTGYDPDGEAGATEVIQKLLDPPPAK